MKGAATVSDGAADGGKGAVRRNQPLLDSRVPPRARQDIGEQSLPPAAIRANVAQRIQQHGLDHETVVIVPMKVRPIPVKAIAHKPLFVLAASIIASGSG